jgi:FkbM family methyltransferase
MKGIVKIARGIIRGFGYDVVKYPVRYPSELYADSVNFLKLLLDNKINLIFDIGANDGRWAERVFKIGYEGRIVSFEPLSCVYDKLLKASKSNPKWEISERCAIGDSQGIIEINISKNIGSSSILPLLKTHLDAEPDSVYLGSEKVKLYKLDTIAAKYLKAGEEIFLKIDVQGYEDRVLNGAREILTKVKGIQLELSLVPVYKEGLIFEKMLEGMNAIGFELCYLSPAFYHPITGRLLQVDCVFFRTSS